MKNVIATILMFLSVSASAATLKASQSQTVDYNSSIEDGFTYDLVVSSAIVPLKVFSAVALNNPITLAAICDGVNIGQSSLLYDSSIRGKSFNLVITVKDFERKCKSNQATFNLIPNGVEIEIGTPWFAAYPSEKGPTFENIRSTRPVKSLELIKIMKGLSNLGGSKAAFYCLIKGYDRDPLMSLPSDPSNPNDKGIMQTMKDEYARLYVLWDNEKGITCPAAAKGALAKNVKECEADPSDLTPFCLVYDRYLKTRAWYYDSIARLQQINNEASEAAEEVKIEIDDLTTRMSSEIKQKEETLGNEIAL